ncbi:MAG TPA: SCO family protein [Thermoanaerobaculia bacterium]|nr:SCO family protein [Thermoanaerobaculia bacterium]
MSHCSIPILALVAAFMAAITLPPPVLSQDTPPPAGEHEHHQHHPSNHEHHAAPAPREDAPEDGKATSVRVPDLALVDQDGKPVRFYSDLVQGKVVMINFIFTSCTTICPPMGATFGKVRQLLGDRAGRDVHLISVSVDPVTDTPERMKAWGAKFGAGPGWTLVTGERETVTQLLKVLGAYNADINDHTPLVLAGNDPQGQWTRAYGLAAPAKLVEMADGLVAQTTVKKEAQ